MKKNLLSVLTLFSITLSAQTTLTQSFNEPKSGDLESTYNLDTSSFSAGLPNLPGNNVTWNFQNLFATQPVIDNYYLSASSVTNSSNYPGCTFVQEANGIYTYFKSTTTPTTQTEILGIQTNTLSINFTNSGIIAKYPIAYGSSSTDNLSGTFTFSLSGTCSGNVTTAADGQGTLNLPGGLSFTNILRVKSVQTITLTAFFTQLGTIRQTIYNYYKSSQKFPVLSINYSYIDVPLLGAPNTSGYAAGSTNFFVTGLKENVLENTAIHLYPNPVQTNLTLAILDNSTLKEIKMYNQLGELVLKSQEAENINVSALTKGIYMAEIFTDKGISRKKIIKE